MVQEKQKQSFDLNSKYKDYYKNEHEQKITNLNYSENPLEWIRVSSSCESF